MSRLQRPSGKSARGKKISKKRIASGSTRRVSIAVKPAGRVGKFVQPAGLQDGPLSEDMKEPAVLRAVAGMTQRDLARAMGISERSLLGFEKAGLGKASMAMTRKYREFHKLFDALAEFVKVEAIGRWLSKPNEVFQGSSPLQVIERGDSGWVWSFVYQLRSGEPM